jgi:predicted nucleotidyltransferase
MEQLFPSLSGTHRVDFAAPVQALIPGAQGRILAVLSETTAELNLRTVARLSGVSLAQASRIMPALVQLGIVARRDVPPSALFHLVAQHVAARPLLELARARLTVLDELGHSAGQLAPPPASVVVYGSFARGDSRPDSDIDLLVVRSHHVSEDDNGWHDDLETWRRQTQQHTGDQVEILEVDEHDAGRHLRSRRPLWAGIRRDGIVVHGRTLDDLAGRRSA